MHVRPSLAELTGRDRLIVALDVPTHEEAIDLVHKLPDVSFFKVGLQLLMSGDLIGFLGKLQETRSSGVFVDLKLSGDIGNTITGLVEACMTLNVKFITLVESSPRSITIRALQAAKEARDTSTYPQLLMVPLLSSMNADDLLLDYGIRDGPEDFIVKRGQDMLNHGCDGLIVSGQAIKACRSRFPNDIIVSPGIRPSGISSDDHKRSTTPSEAILYGADYLVVGRPITKASNHQDAALRIIDEIDEALKAREQESSDMSGPLAATG